jgi:hypothetical protein
LVLKTFPASSIAMQDVGLGHEMSSIGVVSVSACDHPAAAAVGLVDVNRPPASEAKHKDVELHQTPVSGIDEIVEKLGDRVTGAVGFHAVSSPSPYFPPGQF